MEVTQEKLQMGKKGTGWILAKPNILKKQTKNPTPDSQQPPVTANI